MDIKELMNRILLKSGIKDPNAEATRMRAYTDKRAALTEDVAKYNMFGAGLAVENCDIFLQSGKGDLFSSDRARILKVHAREVEAANYDFIKKSGSMDSVEKSKQFNSSNYDLYWVGNAIAPNKNEQHINVNNRNGVNPYMAEPQPSVRSLLVTQGYDDHMFIVTAKLEKRLEGLDNTARTKELVRFLGNEKEALRFDSLLQNKDEMKTRPEMYKLISKMAENNYIEYSKYQQQENMKGF